MGAGSGVNSLLQAYLNGISSSISSSVPGGTPVVGLINNDLTAGSVYTVSGSSGKFFEEFTNTDSVGGISTVNAAPYPGLAVAANVTNLLVEVPGRSVVTGNGNTSLALFGATSNVVYTDTNGGTTGAADSIFAAGGRDVISAYGTNVNPNSSYDIVLSGGGTSQAGAGKDTVNVGAAFDTVTADGNSTATVYVYGGATTVNANDSSTVAVQFAQNAGGTLDFINNSSNAATVFSGNYGVGKFAPNSVTAYGGAGGGYYVGGRAGSNSLVGGSGAVTLQAAGAGDYLQGNSSVGNLMFAYQGSETLIGSATSSNNTFQLGLAYTGSTGAVVANAVVSTAGSGQQAFILGSSSSSTLTGSNSSVSGTNNLYIFVSNAATTVNGTSNYLITDFSSANSSIYLNDTIYGSTNTLGIFSMADSTAPGFSGAVITLTDGSTIKLSGVTAASLTTVAGSTGANSIVIT
ncbi:hypothetical protein GCM10010909_02550 [Acidocella aquatica]|uniref:Uncharacterized protein n=1 Tax=Acidocella aquatica TaxID=1922313 RepID=A0ABQ6A2P4_9PROT|nr:hypothetical protein GCM10010909_02550 [Acidocella aquatica]